MSALIVSEKSMGLVWGRNRVFRIVQINWNDAKLIILNIRRRHPGIMAMVTIMLIIGLT